LDETSIAQAWELLLAIHQAGQARLGALAVIEPDAARLHRLLTTLQMLGYIDLHRGEQDWFYTVCSPREAELRALEN
jgi:DNA-binding IclR family transcriptional regulator